MPNNLPQFSFRNKVREALYKRNFMAKSKFHNAVFSLDAKSFAYPFVEKLGVSTPNIFFRKEKLENIKFETLNSSFVLKPEQSHSSIGVSLVFKEKNKNIFGRELLTNSDINAEKILEVSKKVMEEKNIQNSWLVEELILPDDNEIYPIDDWKFYCFYGEVGLILQKRKYLNGDVLYKLYDNNYEIADKTGKYIGKINLDLPIAKYHQEMLQTAKLLSSNIPTPFMRVDLFSSSRGTVFGEFTPFPGGFSMFWNTWDSELGKMWLEAETRLDIDTRNGKFQNLYQNIKNMK